MISTISHLAFQSAVSNHRYMRGSQVLIAFFLLWVPEVGNSQSLPEPIEVFNRHINAIGGDREVAGLSDIEIKMNLTTRGQILHCTLRKKTTTKFQIPWIANGELIYALSDGGNNTYIVDHGLSFNLADEDSIDFWLLQGLLIPERFYSTLGIVSSVTGVEIIEGTECYMILNKTPNQSITWVDYYDINSGLKILSQVQPNDGLPGHFIRIKYMLYRKYKTLVLPSVTQVIDASDRFTFIVEQVKINCGLKDSDFLPH